MSQKTWNCFDCGQTIYFNRNVKRKDKPDKPQALDAPFQEGDQFPVIHECGKKKQYVDYQQLEQQQKKEYYPYNPQQEEEKEVKIVPSSVSSNLVLMDRKRLEDLENSIEYIKQLVEVIVKSLDKIQQTQNKEGVLFTSAKNLSGTTGNRNTENPGEKKDVIEEEEEQQESESQQAEEEESTAEKEPE